MAEYISEKELRLQERQRKNDLEEERLKILERKMKEKHGKEMRDLKLQQEIVRKEKSEKLKRRKEMLEKQRQIEELRKELTEEKQRLESQSEIVNDIDSAEVNDISQEKVTDIDNENHEHLSDIGEKEQSCDSVDIIDDIEQENNDAFEEIESPNDASSYIDSHRENLHSIEREIQWLEEKEKKCKTNNDIVIDDYDDRVKDNDFVIDDYSKTVKENALRKSDVMKRQSFENKFENSDGRKERDTARSIEKVKDESKVRNRHSLENEYSNDKRRETDKRKSVENVKVENEPYDRQFEINTVKEREEGDEEENELRDMIKQLQIRKRDVEENIKRNKILKEKERKERERKRLEELRIKKEMQQRRELRLRKLIDEKEKLESELSKQEETLDILEKERVVKIETKGCERYHRNRIENEEIGRDKWKNKLLNPSVPHLTENTFEEWKMELEVIIDSDLYDENALRQAVRNSLRGQTRKILLTIPPSTTTREIINKLENVYGNVRSGESVLAEFYMAKQRMDEGIAEWGIRLESIIQKAIEKGHIKESQRDEMLKTRFWRQLHNEELKNATRMYFETAKSFEELRKKVRLEENELLNENEEYCVEERERQVEGHTETTKERKVLQELLDRMTKLEREMRNTRVDENRNRYRDTQRNEKYTDIYTRKREGYVWNRGYGNDRRDTNRENFDNRNRRRYTTSDRETYRRDYRDYNRGDRGADYRNYEDRKRREHNDENRYDDDRRKVYHGKDSHRDTSNRNERQYRYSGQERRQNQLERGQSRNNDDRRRERGDERDRDRTDIEYRRDRQEIERKSERELNNSPLNSKGSLSGGR